MRAGDRAVSRSAYQEEVAHFSAGLRLADALPDPADQARRQGSYKNCQQRHQENRNDDHGNERAAIAEGVFELLEVDDADVPPVHPLTTRTKMSSNECRERVNSRSGQFRCATTVKT